MGYRDAARQVEQRQGDVLLRADVSGEAGAAGARGADGADGGGRGADGQHGAPAGHASAGRPGGHIAVMLVDRGGGQLDVDGTQTKSVGGVLRLSQSLEFGEAGFIDLVARGGRGGDGGQGGNGGSGARGRRGDDATRYSSGGNGGRGGDGGDGGPGTSGAPGGPGGRITVRTRNEDTHLLMLVRQGVEGAEGGRPGVHGHGGDAGAGGSGGSSYSWTTTETDRGPNGEVRTHTRHHSNPGGHSGPSGRPGSSGMGPLYEGARGDDGAFTIEVEIDGQIQRYPSRYHLVLAGLVVTTQDADGITEPGERVELRDLLVANTGGMPTPSTREIRIEVRDSDWVRPILGAHVVVPPGLPSGKAVRVSGPIAFELKEHVAISSSDPLGVREPIALDAFVPAVARSFTGFLPPAVDAQRTMLVRYPVAASILEALPTLAGGEVSRLRFGLLNQSARAVGAGSEGRRIVRARLRLHETELDDRDMVFVDETGQRVLLGGEGLVRDVPHLVPGAHWTFEGAIGVRAGSATYRAVRLRLSLELGGLGAPDVPGLVQLRDLEIRVGERLSSGKFDWLLVTQQHSTRQEVEAWRTLATSAGARLSVYDLSLYGDLALDSPWEGGPSLLERAEGALVIVPDRTIERPEGWRPVSSFLTPSLLAEMGRHRADLLLLGGALSLPSVLMAGDLPENGTPIPGTDALFVALETSAAMTEGLPVQERIEVHEVVFGFEAPSEARLAARAEKLAERLARRFCDRSFDVVWEFDPDITPSWAPIRRRRLGFIQVHARGTGRSGVAHVACTPDTLQNPRRILSEDTRTATVLARGLDDRLAALERELQKAKPDMALASALVDATLLSVAADHLATLRRTRARDGLSRIQLAGAMRTIQALTSMRLLGEHAPDSAVADLIARLAARARFFARAQARLWERVIGIRWARRAGLLVPITDACVRAFIEQQTDSKKDRRVLEDRVRVEDRALAQAWKAAKAEGTTMEAFARQLLLAPAWGEAVTLDEELMLAHVPRCMSIDEWRAERHAVHGARANVAKAQAHIEDERARLALKVTAESLLGQAEVEAPAEDEAERVQSERRASAR